MGDPSNRRAGDYFAIRDAFEALIREPSRSPFAHDRSLAKRRAPGSSISDGLKLTWDDFEELADSFGSTPVYLSAPGPFHDLHRWICALPDLTAIPRRRARQLGASIACVTRGQ